MREAGMIEKSPLAIDLFCGLGGWAEGFLAVGFDIERHDYGTGGYPGTNWRRPWTGLMRGFGRDRTA